MSRFFRLLGFVLLALYALSATPSALLRGSGVVRHSVPPTAKRADKAQAVGVSAPADAKPPVPKARLEGLDDYIPQVMKDWKVPGLAIAVVQDEKVILSRGYGLRDVQKNLPVTSKTLFAIGSITKSFTVTVLGMLVDEVKLGWDNSVREYLPGFQLYDPVANDHITPRDLVTHRSGLPRHDLVWYSSDFTREELIERLRYLEPSKEFRSTYQYNNLMFMTAGYLAGRVSGMSWEEVVRQRVLAPLGMQDTNFSVLDSQKSSDFARPFGKAKDEIKEIPFYFQVAIGPAGEINTNVEDLGQYLLFHMNKGKYGDKQLLSETNAVQMQTPQMVIGGTPRYKELGDSSYGMALGITTYRGHKLVSHGGAIDGFTASFGFLPQDRIGVVVLSNLDGNPLPTIVSYNVYDRLLGLDQVPWSERFLEDRKKAEQAEEEAKKKGYTPRVSGTHPSHDLKDYVGDYENPGYGTVGIALDGSGFKASLNRLHFPLRHFHYDVFEVPENPLDPLQKRKVMFFTDVKGDIATLAIPLQPDVKDIVFTRMAPKAMTERTFLESLVGQYVLGAATATVSLEGEKTLTLLVPGQPKYELIPRRTTTFDIKGLSGYSLEFKKDAAGKVTEAVFYQPNGTFLAKRKEP